MEDCPVESWWAPWQVELVEDRTRAWQKIQFQPSGAIEIVVNGIRLLRKAESGEAGAQAGDWDHEHCSLCWGKISLLPSDEPEGFTDGKNWLCKSCFSNYVEPRRRSAP